MNPFADMTAVKEAATRVSQAARWATIVEICLVAVCVASLVMSTIVLLVVSR